jgi:hypothetical protein
MSDMGTMPIPELIAGLREKAKNAGDDGNILNALVFNVLANRLDEQLTHIGFLEERIQYLVDHWPVPLEDNGITFPDGDFWERKTDL